MSFESLAIADLSFFNLELTKNITPTSTATITAIANTNRMLSLWQRRY